MKKSVFDLNYEEGKKLDKTKKIRSLLESLLFTIVVGFIVFSVASLVKSNPEVNITNLVLILLPILFIISIMYQLGKCIVKNK